MAEWNAPLTPERLEARRALCEAKVTLNGKRAKIMGARKQFATVAQFDTGLSAEWSWEAVARIVANGGNFKA